MSKRSRRLRDLGTNGFINHRIKRRNGKRNYPRYLQDAPYTDSGPIARIFGVFQRLYSMLRIAIFVLIFWWDQRFFSKAPTNGSNLVSTALKGVLKPALWSASVIIAGAIGADLSNPTTNLSVSSRLAVVITLAFLFVSVVAIYRWWEFLDRLGDALSDWVVACNKKTPHQRLEDDFDLFNYTMGDQFRQRFIVNGVMWLAALTIALFAWVVADLSPH